MCCSHPPLGRAAVLAHARTPAAFSLSVWWKVEHKDKVESKTDYSSNERLYLAFVRANCYIARHVDMNLHRKKGAGTSIANDRLSKKETTTGLFKTDWQFKVVLKFKHLHSL